MLPAWSSTCPSAHLHAPLWNSSAIRCLPAASGRYLAKWKLSTCTPSPPTSRSCRFLKTVELLPPIHPQGSQFTGSAHRSPQGSSQPHLQAPVVPAHAHGFPLSKALPGLRCGAGIPIIGGRASSPRRCQFQSHGSSSSPAQFQRRALGAIRFPLQEARQGTDFLQCFRP